MCLFRAVSCFLANADQGALSRGSTTWSCLRWPSLRRCGRMAGPGWGKGALGLGQRWGPPPRRPTSGQGADSGWAPRRLCPCIAFHVARSCGQRATPMALCEPAKGGRQRGAAWGGPTVPALAWQSLVTNQPAPARPRKLSCPCWLDSFLL